MSFGKAKIIRFNEIIPECPSLTASKLPKDKLVRTGTVKSEKSPLPFHSPKADNSSVKSVPATFKTPTLPKKIKTAASATKIKPNNLFNSDFEALQEKSLECENKTKYIHQLSEQLDKLNKELDNLRLEKEQLQREQQKEVQDLEFEMLKTMTQLQRQEEEANIKIKKVEERLAIEIGNLKKAHEYHIGQIIIDCEIKLKDLRDASEDTLKQQLQELEENWKKKLQNKEQESEAILKECQAISEYSIIECELEKKMIQKSLEKITEEYHKLEESHKQLSNPKKSGHIERKYDDKLNKLTKIINEKEEDIKKLSSDIKAYELTINNAQVTIEVLKNRLIHSDRDVELLKEDLARCEEKMLNYEDRYYQVSSELNEARHYNDELELQFESALILNEQTINSVQNELLMKVQMYEEEVKKFTRKEVEEKNMKHDIMEQLNYNIDVIKKINLEVDKTEKCYSMQVNDLKETIEIYAEKEKSYVKSINCLTEENCSLKNGILEKDDKINALEDTVLELNKKNEHLSEKYDYYKSKSEEFEIDTIESSQTRKKYIDLSGRFDVLMQDFEGLKMENKDLKIQFSLLNEKLSDIEEKYEKLKKEKLALETENMSYKNKLEDQKLKKYKFSVKDKENIGSPNRSVIDSPNRGSPFRERN